MSNENDFIKILLEHDLNDSFKILYSETEHKKIILSIMNEIINQYPKFYIPIYYLNQYSVQKWANTIREENMIGLDYLLECIDQTDSLKVDGFFGLTSYTGYRNHKESLINTEKALNYIESNFQKENYKLLKDIHACFAEVSNYIIKKNYKNVLLDFCNNTNFYDFQTQSKFDLFNDDSFAFHNTDILLRNMKNIKRNAFYGVGNDIDFLIIYETINACIKSLMDFPYQKDLYLPTLAYSKGISETKIAIQMNKTRNYVRKNRIQGIKIISQILWGYEP